MGYKRTDYYNEGYSEALVQGHKYRTNSLTRSRIRAPICCSPTMPIMTYFLFTSGPKQQICNPQVVLPLSFCGPFFQWIDNHHTSTSNFHKRLAFDNNNFEDNRFKLDCNPFGMAIMWPNKGPSPKGLGSIIGRFFGVFGQFQFIIQYNTSLPCPTTMVQSHIMLLMLQVIGSLSLLTIQLALDHCSRCCSNLSPTVSVS